MMPLPEPRDDEEEGEFVSRCMDSDAAKEFKDDKQRLAVCYSQYRDRKKAKGSRHFDIRADVQFFDIEGGE